MKLAEAIIEIHNQDEYDRHKDDDGACLHIVAGYIKKVSRHVDLVTDTGTVGEVTGSGRVDRVTGGGCVWRVTGSVGEVTGTGRVGEVTGTGSIDLVTGGGYVGQVTGSIGEVTDTGRVWRVTGTGSVGRVSGDGSVGQVTGSVGEVMTELRAKTGEPCPEGCTTGYPGKEQPVLIERSCDSAGAQEGLNLASGELPFPDDGERWCPQCWAYMGNELAGNGQ